MLARIAFRYDDKRLFSRIVTLVQGGDSAHCEVAYQWDGPRHKCVSASFLDGGVRGKNINMPADKWRIYEIEAAVDPQGWLLLHDGDGYDWLGLLGFFVRRIKGDGDSRFCSEAAAEMLGLQDPWRYDLALLESVCRRYGRRVQ